MKKAIRRSRDVLRTYNIQEEERPSFEDYDMIETVNKGGYRCHIHFLNKINHAE